MVRWLQAIPPPLERHRNVAQQQCPGLGLRPLSGDSTSHPSILSMPTVCHPPFGELAVEDGALGSLAVHIVHPNPPCALPKTSCPVHLLNPVEAQHAAHHVPVLLVPAVVTHCAPTTIMEHLHPALVWAGAIHQANHCEIHVTSSLSSLSFLSFWASITFESAHAHGARSP